MERALRGGPLELRQDRKERDQPGDEKRGSIAGRQGKDCLAQGERRRRGAAPHVQQRWGGSTEQSLRPMEKNALA